MNELREQWFPTQVQAYSYVSKCVLEEYWFVSVCWETRKYFGQICQVSDVRSRDAGPNIQGSIQEPDSSITAISLMAGFWFFYFLVPTPPTFLLLILLFWACFPIFLKQTQPDTAQYKKLTGTSYLHDLLSEIQDPPWARGVASLLFWMPKDAPR